MNLDFDTLMENCWKREDQWPLNGMNHLARILFRSNELGGEAGELQNQVKKYVRHLANMRGPDNDMVKIQEEIGDVIISAVLLAKELGLNPAECVIDKFNKTSEKYNIDIKLHDISLDKVDEIDQIVDLIDSKLEFPITINDLTITTYYESIDAELCGYFNCDYLDLDEETSLKIKQKLIEKHNGYFFGTTDEYNVSQEIIDAINENDLYKVVNDPVSENSDFYGFIGFKWTMGG